MKLTSRGVFWICIGIWAFVFLPYFIPSLNVLSPRILGLPFTVFWQYFAIAVHIVVLVLANKYVWDAFDGECEERVK